MDGLMDGAFYEDTVDAYLIFRCLLHDRWAYLCRL